MKLMFYVMLSMALICFSLLIIIYGLYFLLVINTPKKEKYLKLIENALKKEVSLQQLPNVSILVPAYNEEEAISRKLRNLAALDYPHEKIEVILVDDCSTDKTVKMASQMLNKLDLHGKILENSTRIGVNESYNRGFAECKGDFILFTDADVIIDNDALIKGVKIFGYSEELGGITGKMVPVSSDMTAAVLIENSYRSFFDSMSVSESSIHSTFPGYTCFTLLKKSAFSPLPPHHGSSDGNISLATIRKGLKFLYVPTILFYEPISLRVTEQRRQKIRRASRLIQATLANKDMLFRGNYASFGKTIFPLRFAMMMLSPILLILGLTAMLLGAIYVSVTLASSLTILFLTCVFLGTKSKVRKLNMFSSFVIHQFYLLVGLVFSQKRVAVWRPAERSQMNSKSLHQTS